jgi:hypothetical protein
MTFFQGSLQEGIATALQQSKSVVCFVTGKIGHVPGNPGMPYADPRADGEAESKQWEDDFFGDEEVSSFHTLHRRTFSDRVWLSDHCLAPGTGRVA